MSRQEFAQEFARRMNALTPEQIAGAMESLPTDVLEWAVKFEAMEHHEPPTESTGGPTT
jgi:hypothetical protein